MMKILLAIMLFSSQVFATTAFYAPVEITATTTSTKVMNTNNLRTYLLIQNKGSIGVYVAFAAQAGATDGVLIAAGGAFEPNLSPINEIWIQSASSTSDVVLVQGQ